MVKAKLPMSSPMVEEKMVVENEPERGSRQATHGRDRKDRDPVRWRRGLTGQDQFGREWQDQRKTSVEGIERQ